jgi:hypothetical protein
LTKAAGVVQFRKQEKQNIEIRTPALEQRTLFPHRNTHARDSKHRKAATTGATAVHGDRSNSFLVRKIQKGSQNVDQVDCSRYPIAGVVFAATYDQINFSFLIASFFFFFFFMAMKEGAYKRLTVMTPRTQVPEVPDLYLHCTRGQEVKHYTP